MIPSPPLQIDDREVERIVQQILRRRLGYVPEWSAQDGPGSALTQVFARYLKVIIDRLNQAPAKNKLAFLDRMGIRLIPAEAAEAPIVFQLSEEAADTAAPARTQVAAPPPPESSDQIVFETVRRVGLTPARIKQVVSLWPGRDQYIDHSEDFLADKTITPFDRAQLTDTPHALYIAHDTLLALAGKVKLQVEFELAQVSSEELDMVWEYWDGAVWREFFNQRRECEEEEGEPYDGTVGLTRSGKFNLESDCAESVKTTVNDVEAFWIRGRLDEPLPIDPRQILPDVTQLRISTIIERDLNIAIIGANGRPSVLEVHFDHIDLILTDTNDKPIIGAEVGFEKTGSFETTDFFGGVALGIPTDSAKENDGTYIILIRFRDSELRHRTLITSPGKGNHFVLQIGGLQPDSALNDGQPVDLSKPFFPLGQQPQPGAAFYFTSEEVFTKPGAKLKVHIQKSKTPQDDSTITTETPVATNPPVPIDNTVRWEYWNGRFWSVLLVSSKSDRADHFDLKNNGGDEHNGVVEFEVPDDMALLEVDGEEALWVRVRLVSGGYGYKQTVTWTDDETDTINEFTYVILQPPALADFRLTYVWQDGPKHAERVFTYNDFKFADQTEIARWPGSSFQPYQQLRDGTPSLYVGLDKKLPVDRTNQYFGIIENPKAEIAPALVWEFWNGFNWSPITVEDGTRNLRFPGIVSFIAPRDAKALARFVVGTELYWIRARLKEDGPPARPRIKGIHPNAAKIVQLETVRDEPLGTSNGNRGQILFFPRFPVLRGERIEVRELSGRKAAVQWRILIRELYPGQPEVIRRFEEFLASEKLQLEFTWDDLRIRRDRNKRVVEVWVRWKGQDNFFTSLPKDRHYVLDRASGRLSFGNGRRAMIPPKNEAITAKEFQTGGGAAGNIAIDGITELLGGIAGIDKVFNPRNSEGGADGETLEAFSIRGPRTVRHRGRAITPGDIETMAMEASPAVAVARVAPTRDFQGRRRPGWVTLMIIPRSDEPQPQPSFGLREDVRQDIESRATATMAASHQLVVTGPEYQPVDVDATIAPIDPAAAGEVQTAAEKALKLFLHPLKGGPQSNGWNLGRHVYLSDVASVLERVEGVDYVRELNLLLEGVPQGESLPIRNDKLVAAGKIRINLIPGE